MGTELHPPIERDKKKRKRRFPSVKGGFDPAQVDDFLAAIASSIEALQTELQKGRAAEEVPSDADPREAAPLPAEGDGSDGLSERIARVATVSEREVDRMLAEAKAEAATIVSEAASEADRIRSDAREEADRSFEEARTYLTRMEEDASEMLSHVAEERQQTVEELRETQERLRRVAQDLDALLDSANVPPTEAGTAP